MNEKEEREAAVEAALQAVSDYDDLTQIAALTEAASLLAACCASAIPVDVPITKDEAVKRLMVRKGCSEKEAMEIVEWAIANDGPPKPPRPELKLVRK